MEDYLKINKELWDAKTKIHVESDFYDLKTFIAGKEILNAPELDFLGDISQKSILHLQCHFGMDSLALARKGAKITGIDLSSAAIAKAQQLNKELKLDAQFIESDLYKLPEVLNEQFDIVYTSYGVIGWLPDMDKWAKVISNFLKPGGQFVMVEFHPAVWMFDYKFSQIEYSYFNTEPIVEILEGTYADRNANIKATEVSWNHSLAEVLESLLKHNLEIKQFKEFDYSSYDCFENMVKTGENQFQISGFEGKLPLMYSILCTKK